MEIAAYIGIVLSILHFLFAVGVVYTAFSGTEPDWPMAWLLLFWIDVPYSLVFLLSVKIFDSFKVQSSSDQKSTLRWRHVLFDVPNLILPVIFLGVGGTIWWLYLPRFIAEAFLRLTH